MYERLLYLFKDGRLTTKHLDVAVSKGWISEEQKTEIINRK